MKRCTSRRRRRLFEALGMAAALALSSASASAQTFSPTGSMAERRHSHTATLLTNGLVLIAGGGHSADKSSLSGAELFDPATGTFRPTGSLNTSRVGATLVPQNHSHPQEHGGRR